MIRFGVQLWQEEFNFEGLKRAWREVEEMGFDSAWLYDHFYPMSNDTSWYILEPWTVLPCLAAETKRLRLGVIVTCNSYRYPSVLAKIAATVDVISEGRLEFGIGAGWHQDEYIAYGIPFPDVKTRIEQLAEAVELIKRIWTEERATFQGKYYAIKDLISYPKPIQKPHPPIWIGGKSDRLLRITAQHANYANFAQCTPGEFQQKLEALRKHCENMGRKFEEIEKTWHGFVIIVEKEKDLKKKALKFKEASMIKKVREMSLEKFLDAIIGGTPEQCIEKIQEYIDLGVTYFIPHFPFAQDLEPLRIFMEKVASAFK